MLKNSYWNSTGKYQTLSDELEKSVPMMGSVEQPQKNKALEKFRKASNCYYDLYNNGLGNRVHEFRKVFGISSSHYKIGIGRTHTDFSENMYREVEKKMDEIIIDAAIEQGLIKYEDTVVEMCH